MAYAHASRLDTVVFSEECPLCPSSPRLRVMQLTRASRRLILSVRITAGEGLDPRGGDPSGGRFGFIPDDLAVEDEGALGLVHLLQRRPSRSLPSKFHPRSAWSFFSLQRDRTNGR
jgi:hypothetical protein